MCKKYTYQILRLSHPISREALKIAINKISDATVPGSELIKILAGLSDSPENQQEWLKLALDTALDLVPGSKIFKFLKGPAVKLGIKQIGVPSEFGN